MLGSHNFSSLYTRHVKFDEIYFPFASNITYANSLTIFLSSYSDDIPPSPADQTSHAPRTVTPSYNPPPLKLCTPCLHHDLSHVTVVDNNTPRILP